MFYDHGKEDTIICGSCRTVCNNVKSYIEHRRQKKCNFFEREVAPSTVSCFTCKEEFSEPWLFIQHLIHRHSINLYRDQPESDPVKYIEKTRNEKKGEAESDKSAVAQDQTVVATESNGVSKEHEKSVEANGTNNQDEVMIVPDESTATSTGSNAAPKPTTINSTENNGSPLNNSTMDADARKTPVQSTNESVSKEVVVKQEPMESSNSAENDIPSYSSAISIGVSSRNPVESLSSMFAMPMGILSMAPSFHSQMSVAAFCPQQPPPIPSYHFTQPIASTQTGYPSSSYAPTTMMSSMYDQAPPAPQISLPQFMAQSSAAVSNQGGLSEEEQLRLLQEFEDN